MFSNKQKNPSFMFPEVLLNFIGIFTALLSFIITLVWGIKAMYSEIGHNEKLQSFPIIIFWFLLISKLPHAQFSIAFLQKKSRIFDWITILCFSAFSLSLHFVSVLLWHFTAVSCSVCKDVEDEREEEAEFRRTGEQRDQYENYKH